MPKHVTVPSSVHVSFPIKHFVDKHIYCQQIVPVQCTRHNGEFAASNVHQYLQQRLQQRSMLLA